MGTADYLAPEIIVSPEKLQTISDIYSLGCTLYYAVTGKVPFPGGDTADKLRRQLDETPLAPQKLNPSVSDDFARVIAALMEKRPADRVSTAKEVMVLLKPWVAGTEVVAREHVGSLTKLSGSLIHNSNLADTLPEEDETSETQDAQQDSTDAGTIGGVTLPQIVVADRVRKAKLLEENAQVFKETGLWTRSLWPWQQWPYSQRVRLFICCLSERYLGRWR